MLDSHKELCGFIMDVDKFWLPLSIVALPHRTLVMLTQSFAVAPFIPTPFLDVNTGTLGVKTQNPRLA